MRMLGLDRTQRGNDVFKKHVTKAAFREWLKSLDPNQIIGHMQCPEQCPLASFVAQSVARKVTRVRSFGVSVIAKNIQIITDRGNFTILTPRWAHLFMRGIDNLPAYYFHRVSAKKALYILERI